jgi:hypothetical protein
MRFQKHAVTIAQPPVPPSIPANIAARMASEISSRLTVSAALWSLH